MLYLVAGKIALPCRWPTESS